MRDPRTHPTAVTATEQSLPGAERARSGTGAAPPRGRRGFQPQDIALIGVFAALVVVSSVVPPIYLSFVPVPITLQTLVVTLTAMLLGAWRGFATLGLYLLLGLVGLPIFSGFRGGIGVFAGPSAGYLIAFAVMALVIGAVASVAVRYRGATRAGWFVLAGALGLVVSQALGVAGMMLNAKLSFGAAVTADLVFLPGDAVKIALAILIVLPLHRAFPQLLGRRRGR